MDVPASGRSKHELLSTSSVWQVRRGVAGLYPSLASVELDRRGRCLDDVEHRDESKLDGMLARVFERLHTKSLPSATGIDEQSRDDTQHAVDASGPNGLVTAADAVGLSAV